MDRTWSRSIWVRISFWRGLTLRPSRLRSQPITLSMAVLIVVRWCFYFLLVNRTASFGSNTNGFVDTMST